MVTPEAAAATVLADDALTTTANATLDLNTQDGHEGGARALLDDAFFAVLREHGLSSPIKPFAHEAVSAFVPFQTTYPATFLAFARHVPAGGTTTTSTTVATPGPRPSGDQFFVFTRQWATAPWKVVDSGALDPGALRPVIQLDCNGFAVTAAALDPALAVPPGSLATRMAGYLDTYDSATPPRSDFLGGPETTTHSAALRSGATQATGLGAVQSFSAAPSVFPTNAWRTTDGGAFVVFSVSDAVRIIPLAGRGPITQPANHNVWPLLQPGSYPEVVWHYLGIVAATIPSPSASPLVAPIAYNYEYVSTSIDPCRLVTSAQAAGAIGAAPSVDARRDATSDICEFTTPLGASLTVATRLATATDKPTGTAVTDLGVPAGYAEAATPGLAGAVTGTLEFLAHGSRITVTINRIDALSTRSKSVDVAKLALAAASKL